MKWKKGVTLVELLAVIVILGIIASISIIMLADVIKNSRIKADIENVNVLNRATYYYTLSESDDNLFAGLSSNEERIDFLVEEGYLNKVVSASVKDTEFIWDSDSSVWVYSLFEEATETITEIDFSLLNLDDYEKVGDWDNSEGTLISDSGLIFIDNPRNEYTITVTGKIEAGTYGGFGILFDTSVIDGEDTGYVLQLDRGYGRGSVVIRPRENGDEGSVIQSHRFDHSNSFIPDKNTSEGSEWWSSEHEVELTVFVTEGVTYTKILSVKIDGVLLFDDFVYETSVSEVNNFTGLRTWSGVEVEFYTFDIE